MFGNIFRNQLRLGLRNKNNVFWTLMYPIILGTLFYAAFGNIYSEFSSDAIPTAVVYETDNEQTKETIKSFLENLEMSDHKMLEITYMDLESARNLLMDDEKVNGIIHVLDNGKLSLDLYSNGVRSTILENITTIYNQNVELIETVAKEHPENLQAVLNDVMNRISYINTHNMEGDNKDPFIAYFYNLIAMTALFAAFNSVSIGNNCQANASHIGARSNASPVKRMTFQAAGFLAAYLVQTVVVSLGLAYLIFILKINFGGDTLMVFVTTAIATLVGVSLGFFVGNIGKMALSKKISILVAVALVGGALSGLMYGDMKVIIAEKMPILNKINPAALISDSYYTLNLFGTNERYFGTVIGMLIISAVFLVLGLFLGRRNHYDSI